MFLKENLTQFPVISFQTNASSQGPLVVVKYGIPAPQYKGPSSSESQELFLFCLIVLTNHLFHCLNLYLWRKLQYHVNLGFIFKVLL